MSEPGSRPARLHDVAREAGVHVSTASRVLNGNGTASVSEETRERIVAAARLLRYRPNAIARGLKLASTGALGLLVPSLRNPIYTAVIRGAFDRAWERRFVVVLAEDRDDSSAQQAYERLVEEGRIDGILVASARPGSPLLERFAEQRVPCVFVNRRHLGSGRNVAMREEDAGRIAAEHLLALGHRRLAHIAGPLELDTARRRADGFAAAAASAGCEAPTVAAPFEERGGFQAMTELLGTADPTGVFVSNINQSIGALAAARRAGRAVPADLSIVGYDDDPLAEYLEAPLTTVRMPLYELGRVAVDALIDQLEGAAARDLIVDTAPELVARRSSGPAPAPA